MTRDELIEWLGSFVAASAPREARIAIGEAAAMLEQDEQDIERLQAMLANAVDIAQTHLLQATRERERAERAETLAQEQAITIAALDSKLRIQIEAKDASIRLWASCDEDLQRAEAERDALRQDADRWRFYREHSMDSIDGISVHEWIGRNRLRLGGLDAAIDAAMKDGK